MSSEGTKAAGDDTYVHQPGGIESGDDGEQAGDAVVDGHSSAAGDNSPDGFGRQGWLLVAGVVVCFLVIPGVIYLKPTAPAAVGLPFFATFLVLPLIPAVILGLLAVWSMRAAD